MKLTDMNKQIILTGVAGFIGAHTLEHILETTDWDVVGIDSLQHRGDYRRIKQVLSKNQTWAARFEFHRIDLAKITANDLAEEIGLYYDYIINMASESHVDRSIDDPVPFVRNNVELTLTMLEYSRLCPPSVFIQISTDEVYGPMYNNKPYQEWDTIMPSNPYSASKAAQEAIAISYWRTYGIPVVITNTMNNIGEMQDPEKFFPMIIRDIKAGRPLKIHGTPQEIGSRYYLHARNHADACVFLLNYFEFNNLTLLYDPEMGVLRPPKYHIVGDTRLTNLEVAQRISAAMGYEGDYPYDLIDFHSTRPGHDMHYGLDGTKIEELGWKAPVSFDESLERTIKGYMEHPEWLK